MTNDLKALKLDADDMITIENSLEMAYQSFKHEISCGDHDPASLQNLKAIVSEIEKTLNKFKEFLDNNEAEIISNSSNRLTKTANLSMIEKKDDDEWQ